MTWCHVCGMAEMSDGQDGAQFCQSCGAQSLNYIEEEFDEADAFRVYNAAFVRERGVIRNEEQGVPGFGSQKGPEDPFGLGMPIVKLEDETPSTPGFPFGSASGTDAYLQGSQLLSQASQAIQPGQLASMIRSSYVNGLQKILQLQCEGLVEDFGVTPLICGIVAPIWLKYVASSRVFEEVWADEAIEVAEDRERNRKGNNRRVHRDETEEAMTEATEPASLLKQRGKRNKKKRSRKGKVEPRTSYGVRCRFVWLHALKERIPLAITLAICYLACYIAREPVLPTDIRDWATNAQLPYLNAFLHFLKPSPNHNPNTVGGKQVFPMEPRLMFKPLSMVGARGIELLAGTVAERIGLQLPPVNFHSLTVRFFNELGLSMELLDSAFRLYDWYSPAGFWLSSRPRDLPTRVYVMAILVITIKIFYTLSGNSLQSNEETGIQMTLQSLSQTENRHINKTSMAYTSALPKGGSDMGERCPAGDQNKKGLISTKALLERLDRVKEDKSMDLDEKLLTYLRYCREVIFPGQSIYVDQENIRDHFWGIYSKNKVTSKDTDKNALDGISGKGKEILGSQAEVGGVVEDNAEEQFYNTGKTGLQPGSHGREEMEGVLLRDALSAVSTGSVRTEVGYKQVGAQQKNNKGKGKLLDTEVLSAQETDESAPAQRVNNINEDLTKLIADMKKTYFSLLPAWTGKLSAHHYMRYRFRVSADAPVHADYFCVLRACAKMIDVHPRALHWCVQIMEEGLIKMENSVEKFLQGQGGDVSKLAHSINRNRIRKRDKLAEAERAKYKARLMKDLSYLV